MEEDKLKEREELERLLGEPDEDQEDSAEDKSKDTETSEDEDNGGTTPPSGAESEDEGEENSEENNDKKDESEEDNDNQDAKTRWNGKSREEVIKEYESLEQRIAALEGKDKPKEDAPEDKDKPKESGSSDLPSPEELQKMTPSDFAQWVMQRIDDGVKKTIESHTQIRDSVKKEISEAKKEHPLGDPDYRKMVLAIIDAASAKGTVIPLKEACKQVDAFLGKHKGEPNDATDISDEERSRLKKAKAQVESGAGAPAQPDGSDAETKRIQKALGRSGSRGSLGGLGL